MADVDLNLVRVFVAVYETGSVSAAAARLNVTQPSVSHALARLRDLLRSPLFTRGRQGMTPTALAEELYPSFQGALSSVETAVARVLVFDPAQSRRTFRLAMTDFGEIAFLPAIMHALAAKAPLVSLDVLTVHIDTVRDWLFHGKADAAICLALPQLADARWVSLFTERYQCIHRIGHPRIGSPMTLDIYLDETHVAVAGSTGHHIVETHWREAKLAPKVALRLPNLGVLEAIIANSDYLAAVPSRIASAFAAMGRVAASDVPLPLPAFEVRLHWWDHSAPAAEDRWFRSTILEAVQTL